MMEWPESFHTDEPTPIRRRLREPDPWPDSFAVADEPSPIKRQLQGPRPTPLRVGKDSNMIKKPPVVPHHSHPPRPPQPPAAADRQPVIIYAVSPKVIHTTVNDFMNLVQRLTGSSSSSTTTSLPSASTAGVDHFPAGGAVSPAARLASIEKTSPSGREKDREKGTDLMGMIFNEVVEMGQMMPGILSPAPASLTPIPSGFFSPGFDMSYNPFFFSGFFSPAGASNMYMPSPSTLFSAPMVSQSPYSYDLLSQFLDF